MSLTSVKTKPDLDDGKLKGHEIKQEVVLGPNVLQLSDLVYHLNGKTEIPSVVENTAGKALGTNEMVRLAPENMGGDYGQSLPDSPQATDTSAMCVKEEPTGDDELLMVADLGPDEMVRLGLTPESMDAEYDEIDTCQSSVAVDVKKEVIQPSQNQSEEVKEPVKPNASGLPASHVSLVKEEPLTDEAGDSKVGIQRRSRRITSKNKADEPKREFTKYSSRLTFETDSEDNDTDSEYEEKSHNEESNSEESDTDQKSVKSTSSVKKQKLNVKQKLKVKQKKRHICEFCNKEFNFRAGLTNHIRTHTGEKPYSCNICSKRFSDCAVLVRHRRMHSGDKPHVCDVCGRRYSEKYLLKNHKLVHTGEMQYFCKFCPKQFVNSSNYRRHQKVHMHKFICDTCDKPFAKKDSLISHIINHMKPKPYACKYCKKCFGNTGHLNRHLVIHTGKKEMFSCENCRQEFTQKVSLKRHVQKKVCKKKNLKK